MLAYKYYSGEMIKLYVFLGALGTKESFDHLLKLLRKTNAFALHVGTLLNVR